MKTYESTYRAKWMFDGCKTISEMIERLDGTKKELEEYQKLGVELGGEVQDDYGFLITKDKKIAEKLGFHEIEEDDVDFVD